MRWWVEERRRRCEIEKKGKLEKQWGAAAEDSSVPVEEIKGLHPVWLMSWPLIAPPYLPPVNNHHGSRSFCVCERARGEGGGGGGERKYKSPCVHKRWRKDRVYMREGKWAVYMYSASETQRMHAAHCECTVNDWLGKMCLHVQCNLQHDINSACQCVGNTDDIFTNSCGPPAESSSHIVTRQEHLCALWAPSGNVVSQCAVQTCWCHEVAHF